MRKRTKTKTPTLEETVAQLRASLRQYRIRVASQERKIARLLSINPQLLEQEREISRLEGRVEDLTQLLEDVELEIHQLQRQVRGAA